MDGDIITLIAANVAFVGTHFALSHPLRAPLVARLGEKGFLPVYSLVAFATLGWMILAFRGAPRGARVRISFQEDADFGVWEDYGTDVTSFHHHAGEALIAGQLHL